MARDPHDALLLTPRRTTVVTQGTTLLDTMPSPYGASADEEELFTDRGGSGDPGDELAAIEDQAPMVVPAGVTPPIVVTAQAPATTPKWLWIAGGVLALGALGFFGRKKR